MYEKTTLPNGLRLVTSAYPHTRSVSLAIFLAAGPRFEKPEIAGISHFVEHLCFKGTKRWPTSQQVSEAIEGVGGILNGGTDKELTIYWCKVAQTHFQLALDLLTDIVRHANMDAADTDRERPIIIEELNMCLDSPQNRVDQLSDELLWPGQPLGRDIGGSKETVSAITHRQILDYTAQRYLPNNAVVAIAGNVSHGQVTDAVAGAMGDWKKKASPAGYPSNAPQRERRMKFERRDIEQVNLCLALRGVSQTDPDRYKLDLMNAVLGEGMSSRLFAEIREKRCLAYDIHSAASHYTDTGSLSIFAGVDPKNFKEAVKAVLHELDRIKTDVPEAEVAKAREMAKGRLLLRMEDTRNVVSWLGAQELSCGRILTPDEVVAIIDSIHADDIKAMANKILKTDQLSLAVVGPVGEEEFPIEELKV